jgi:hypothetical protein
MIDDATGQIYGQFHAYEGTLPAMACFKGYVQKYGISLAVYLDRHTTYTHLEDTHLEDTHLEDTHLEDTCQAKISLLRSFPTSPFL